MKEDEALMGIENEPENGSALTTTDQTRASPLRQNISPGLWTVLIIGGILVSFAVIKLPPTQSTQEQVPVTTSVPVPSTPQTSEALAQMASVFPGNHSPEELQSILNRVMPMYGMSISEDNYRHCGNALVEATKEYGVSETAILQDMLRLRQAAPNAGMNFSDGVVAACLDLTNGRAPRRG